MALFGTVKTEDRRVIYLGTKTDEIMNYVCGVILIAYILIGLYVNLHLICYYKSNRHSWMDKYLFYISFVRLVYVLTTLVPCTYSLLNDRSLVQNFSDSVWWEIPFNLMSIISSIVLMVLDTVIVAIQYSNIHHPSWALHSESYSTLMKFVGIPVGALVVIGDISAVIYGQTHRERIKLKFPLSKEFVTDTAIANIPAALPAYVITSIYLVTWIRFCYQVREIRVVELVKREFKLVSALVLSDIIGSVSFTVYVVDIAIVSEANVCRSVYIGVFSGILVPLTASTIVACYTLISEKNLRDKVFGSFCQSLSDYERIN